MFATMLVEDIARLHVALTQGLIATGAVQVVSAWGSGEEALEDCLAWMCSLLVR